MKTIKISLLAITLLIGLFIISCQKEETTADKDVTLSEATVFASDDASASNSFDEVYVETDGAAAEMDGLGKWGSSTSTKSIQVDSSRQITVRTSGGTLVVAGSGDTVNWPKTVIITYTNWKTKSGHIIKSGTITMTQTKRMIRAGAIRSISIANLIMDDSINIMGTKTITNKGLVSEKPTMEVKLEDGSITNLNTEKSITREFTHTRTWEAGFNTPFNIFDDYYSISGSASGINRFGVAYTSTIIEKLWLKVPCIWIIKGIIEIKAKGKKAVTIDWGYPNTPSTCDWKFKLTYGDNTLNVE